MKQTKVAISQAAQEILNNITANISPKKTISLLSTGKEIISGDLIDSNSNNIAQQISKNGGEIYQIIQTSDNKHEIKNAITYLLNNSDALIITGGLGPTSDDNTRFALGQAVNKELIFIKEAWEHVQNRLNKFNISIAENNKQQALFPEGAQLLINNNGTACGCKLEFQGKQIFMLPGPPKECIPMFELYVLPELRGGNYFNLSKLYIWKTLGLSESQIGLSVEALAQEHKLDKEIEIGYRWSYPYVDIKVQVNTESETVIKFINDLETLVKHNLISKDNSNTFAVFNNVITKFGSQIAIVNNIKNILPSVLSDNPKIILENSFSNSYQFDIDYFNIDKEINDNIIKVQVNGYIHNKIVYSDKISIPNRDSDVVEFIDSYVVWQLTNFIKYIMEQK
ncbi:MAG: competence/damage-inducible protein A [Proteobacteria bacterium]|jgi:nicotinamide-nucleotide amidase|nr:competence/damage-inducible protein A [Pseudomonadota bacterium]